jgi:zinc transport system substrate-binding protein
VAAALLVSIAITAVSWLAPSEPPPIRVVVSLAPQLWLVQSIGGERVSVSTLVAPGESEETYSPTDAQVSEVLRARVFLRIGAGFEAAPWFRTLAASGGIDIVDARAGVDLLPDSDPHVWTSPRRLAAQGRIVASTLARIDPQYSDRYAERLRALQRELEILDSELIAALAPYRGRSFFSFHPSWAYLASDYGLRQIAIEAEGKEPTDRDVVRFQSLARAEGPRLLLVDAQVPARVADALAAAIGASPARLDPLAPDVPANLRRVAAKLVESFAP